MPVQGAAAVVPLEPSLGQPLGPAADSGAKGQQASGLDSVPVPSAVADGMPIGPNRTGGPPCDVQSTLPGPAALRQPPEDAPPLSEMGRVTLGEGMPISAWGNPIVPPAAAAGAGSISGGDTGMVSEREPGPPDSVESLDKGLEGAFFSNPPPSSRGRVMDLSSQRPPSPDIANRRRRLRYVLLVILTLCLLFILVAAWLASSRGATAPRW